MGSAITEGYLLDTNVASAAWDKGSPRHTEVRDRLAELGDSPLLLSVVSLAEIEYGLKVAPSIDVDRQREVRRVMAQYRALPIDRHTAQAYAGIRAALFAKYSPRDRRGRLIARYVEELTEPTSGLELGIQENDLWIASTAVQYNLIFATRDQGGGMRRIIAEASYSGRTEFWTV